ncbi:unnamed protein product [[Candida] boidinii]|nr:unnamed protein product [[Candida] boidinii]
MNVASHFNDILKTDGTNDADSANGAGGVTARDKEPATGPAVSSATISPPTLNSINSNSHILLNSSNPNSNISSPFLNNQSLLNNNSSNPASGMPSSLAPPGLPMPQHMQPITIDPMNINWYYVDPSGTEHGPFNGHLMQQWYTQDYFSVDLKLRRQEENMYTTLGTFVQSLNEYISPFNVPLPPVYNNNTNSHHSILQQQQQHLQFQNQNGGYNHLQNQFNPYEVNQFNSQQQQHHQQQQYQQQDVLTPTATNASVTGGSNFFNGSGSSVNPVTASTTPSAANQAAGNGATETSTPTSTINDGMAQDSTPLLSHPQLNRVSSGLNNWSSTAATASTTPIGTPGINAPLAPIANQAGWNTNQSTIQTDVGSISAASILQNRVYTHSPFLQSQDLLNSLNNSSLQNGFNLTPTSTNDLSMSTSSNLNSHNNAGIIDEQRASSTLGYSIMNDANLGSDISAVIDTITKSQPLEVEKKEEKQVDNKEEEKFKPLQEENLRKKNSSDKKNFKQEDSEKSKNSGINDNRHGVSSFKQTKNVVASEVSSTSTSAKPTIKQSAKTETATANTITNAAAAVSAATPTIAQAPPLAKSKSDIAPWAKAASTQAQTKPTLTLQEIQKMEAAKRSKELEFEQAKKVEEQKQRLLLAQQEEQREALQFFQKSASSGKSSLPATAQWGSGSPVVNNKSTSKKPTKTLADIQREEAEASAILKAKAIAEAEAKDAAASLAASVFGTAAAGKLSFASTLSNSGLSNNFAQGGSSITTAAVIAAAGNSGSAPPLNSAWTVVSNKKVVKPQPMQKQQSFTRVVSASSSSSSAIPPQLRSVSSSSNTPVLGAPSSAPSGSTASSLSGNATSSAPSTSSATTTLSKSSTNSSPSPSREFLTWARAQLQGLNSAVNKEDVLSIMLQLPTGPDGYEIIADTIYSNSSTMDGRRFAQEFSKRRRVVEDIVRKQGLDFSWNEAVSKTAGGGSNHNDDDWDMAFTKVVSKKNRKRN